MQLKSIVCLIFGLFLLGCRNHLSEADKRWNPYQKGDVLVFETEGKMPDTFMITGVQVNPDGKNEIMEVQYCFLERDQNRQNHRDTIHSFILALTSWAKGETVFSFNLYTPNAKFSPFLSKGIKWLDSQLLTEINGHGDVLTLVPDKVQTAGVRQADSTAIGKVYWSKAEGLIGYTMLHGNRTWWLKRK